MRAADLSSQFPAHVRDRGYEYQRREAVQLTTVSGTSIEARVNGTRQYQVRIGVRGSNLDFTCTCPFFQDRGPCKHLWATLVQADQEGLLRTLAQAQGLAREPRGATADPVPARPPTGQPAPRPRAARAWQQLLARARHRADPDLDEPPPPAPPAELLYVVELERVAQTRALVIALRTRFVKKDGKWSKDAPASVSYEALERSCRFFKGRRR